MKVYFNIINQINLLNDINSSSNIIFNSNQSNIDNKTIDCILFIIQHYLNHIYKMKILKMFYYYIEKK